MTAPVLSVTLFACALDSCTAPEPSWVVFQLLSDSITDLEALLSFFPISNRDETRS